MGKLESDAIEKLKKEREREREFDRRMEALSSKEKIDLIIQNLIWNRDHLGKISNHLGKIRGLLYLISLMLFLILIIGLISGIIIIFKFLK